MTNKAQVLLVFLALNFLILPPVLALTGGVDPNLTKGCSGPTCLAGRGNQYHGETSQTSGATNVNQDENCCEANLFPGGILEPSNPSATSSVPSNNPAAGQL
jgi:hypothetical protein